MGKAAGTTATQNDPYFYRHILKYFSLTDIV